eukprot:tig00020563_g11183.t1
MYPGAAPQRSRTFVCFLSQAYAESQNCDDEFQFAHHQLRSPKFPVFLADPGAMRLRPDQEMMLTSAHRTVQAGPSEAAAERACTQAPPLSPTLALEASKPSARPGFEPQLVAKIRAALDEVRPAAA